jgi:hypothetical protein
MLWRIGCSIQGMLRMTTRMLSDSTVFTLEGTLTGLWSKEMLRIARGAAGHDGKIIVDIRRLSHIDVGGKEGLQHLGKRGAKFITDSTHGKDLCTRLKLSRIGDAGMRIKSAVFAGADRRQNPSLGGE